MITKTDVFALNFLPFLYCCFNLQITFYKESQLIQCLESDRRKINQKVLLTMGSVLLNDFWTQAPLPPPSYQFCT